VIFGSKLGDDDDSAVVYEMRWCFGFDENGLRRRKGDER
jgi:hypothetical protein